MSAMTQVLPFAVQQQHMRNQTTARRTYRHRSALSHHGGGSSMDRPDVPSRIVVPSTALTNSMSIGALSQPQLYTQVSTFGGGSTVRDRQMSGGANRRARVELPHLESAPRSGRSMTSSLPPVTAATNQLISIAANNSTSNTIKSSTSTSPLSQLNPPLQQQQYHQSQQIQQPQQQPQQHASILKSSQNSRIRTARSELSLKTASQSAATIKNSNQSASRTELSNSQSQLSTAANSNSSMLSDDELYQIRLMYSGHSCQVTVCSCLANLYFANHKHSSANACPAKDAWKLAATGVPVLLQEQTDDGTRTSLLLAERGTGFTIWRDTFDAKTNYTEMGHTFHTLRLSTSTSRMVGLSFDSQYSAMQFYASTRQCSRLNGYVDVKMRDKSSLSANSAAARSRRHSFSGSAKHRAALKSQISNPCCFSHITALKPQDLLNGHSSMGELNNNSVLNNNNNIVMSNSNTLTPANPQHLAAAVVQLPGDGMISPSRSV